MLSQKLPWQRSSLKPHLSCCVWNCTDKRLSSSKKYVCVICHFYKSSFPPFSVQYEQLDFQSVSPSFEHRLTGCWIPTCNARVKYVFLSSTPLRSSLVVTRVVSKGFLEGEVLHDIRDSWNNSEGVTNIISVLFVLFMWFYLEVDIFRYFMLYVINCADRLKTDCEKINSSYSFFIFH